MALKTQQKPQQKPLRKYGMKFHYKIFPSSNQSSSLMTNSLFIIFQNSAFCSTEKPSLCRGPMTEKVTSISRGPSNSPPKEVFIQK